jgi:hypothetical protein
VSGDSASGRIVCEREFFERMQELLSVCPDACGWVTGPGRSGAIAAVYASHLLHIPFVPFGSFAAETLGRVLIVDTAQMSGRTLRKAARKYEARDPFVWFGYHEPPIVRFWYEAKVPQWFRHEGRTAAPGKSRFGDGVWATGRGK